MHIDILTLFPEMFAGCFDISILKRAQNKGLFSYNLHNIRDYSTDKHHRVDDYPYGGAAGMVMQIEPIDSDNNFILDYSIFDAIRAGFNHVIFIIKKDTYNLFRKTIGNRIKKYISVDYIFQDNHPLELSDLLAYHRIHIY